MAGIPFHESTLPFFAFHLNELKLNFSQHLVGYCFVWKLQRSLAFEDKERWLQQSHSGTKPYRALSRYLLRSGHA